MIVFNIKLNCYMSLNLAIFSVYYLSSSLSLFLSFCISLSPSLYLSFYLSLHFSLHLIFSSAFLSSSFTLSVSHSRSLSSSFFSKVFEYTLPLNAVMPKELAVLPSEPIIRRKKGSNEPQVQCRNSQYSILYYNIMMYTLG